MLGPNAYQNHLVPKVAQDGRVTDEDGTFRNDLGAVDEVDTPLEDVRHRVSWPGGTDCLLYVGQHLASMWLSRGLGPGHRIRSRP